MNRRDTILAALALGTLPLSSLAQQQARIFRVAAISSAPIGQLTGPAPESLAIRGLIQGLKARDFIEGKNFVLNRYSLFGLDDAGIDNLLVNLVRQKPDVIVVPGTGFAVRVAKSGIPIVMASSVDPVGAGLAQSLARPGGNVTGLVTDVAAGAETKRLELLLELLPKARRIAFVGTQVEWENYWGRAVRGVAAKRRVEFFLAAGKRTGFDDALEVVKRSKPDAFFVALSSSSSPFGRSFGEFTVANRIPSSCGLVEMTEQGCLMAYGQSVAAVWTQAAAYVDKILKGAIPGDLPIEQPTKFELVINLKTARALGLTIPQSILLRADQVIE